MWTTILMLPNVNHRLQIVNLYIASYYEMWTRTIAIYRYSYSYIATIAKCEPALWCQSLACWSWSCGLISPSCCRESWSWSVVSRSTIMITNYNYKGHLLRVGAKARRQLADHDHPDHDHESESERWSWSWVGVVIIIMGTNHELA